jgi:hypothetical protein
MEKTNYVLAQIKAVKGCIKAKNNRLRYYANNSERIEKVGWKILENYDYQGEVIAWQKDFDNFEEYKKESKKVNK